MERSQIDCKADMLGWQVRAGTNLLKHKLRIPAVNLLIITVQNLHEIEKPRITRG